MIGFLDTRQTLFVRGLKFTAQEYNFALYITLGETEEMSYCLAFEEEELSKFLDTESEQEFILSKKNEARLLLQQPHIEALREELHNAYIFDIQNKALNLEDYKFTGGQIAQILQNLLHNRVSDLDSASTKDVIALIKLLTEQFGLDGGSDFDRHFIQVYPKFNALCGNCNKEFDICRGVDCVCPHCGVVYHYLQDEDRFMPPPQKL